MTDIFPMPCTDTTSIFLFSPGSGTEGVLARAYGTQAMKDFILLFDDEYYPGLIDKSKN